MIFQQARLIFSKSKCKNGIICQQRPCSGIILLIHHWNWKSGLAVVVFYTVFLSVVHLICIVGDEVIL